MSGADPFMPSDSPLSRVWPSSKPLGTRASSFAQDGGVIRCVAGGHEFAATSARVDQSRRLEGVSDPADSMMVMSLHCPVCRVRAR